MKTKLLIAAIMGALMLLCTFAVADYSGDKPLSKYDRGMTYGGLIFETVEDGTGYSDLNAINPETYEQDLNIDIPNDAEIISARLYNYVTWSTSGPYDKTVPGDPAEAILNFNGVEVICQNPNVINNPIHYSQGAMQYWDSKGQDYTTSTGAPRNKYDFPVGTFAWDVTEFVNDGDNLATITNADSSPETGEFYKTYGFALLVVYDLPEDHPDASKQHYWIMEGADMLSSKYKYEIEPTTSALFAGGIPGFEDGMKGELQIVLNSVDQLVDDPSSPQITKIFFNGEYIGPCLTQADQSVYPYCPGSEAITVNNLEVTLNKHQNIVEFQDYKNEYMVVTNAFLIV